MSKATKSILISASYFIVPFAVVVLGGLHLRHAAFALGVKMQEDPTERKIANMLDDEDAALGNQYTALTVQGSSECGCPGCCALAKL